MTENFLRAAIDCTLGFLIVFFVVKLVSRIGSFHFPRLVAFIWLAPLLRLAWEFIQSMRHGLADWSGVPIWYGLPGSRSIQLRVGSDGIFPFISLEGALFSNSPQGLTVGIAAWLNDALQAAQVCYSGWWLACLWMLVFAILFAKFFQEWRNRSAFLTKIAASAAHSFRVNRVKVCFVDGPLSGPLSGPLTAGFLAPLVIFPRALWKQLTPAARRTALAHEFSHVCWGDVFFRDLTSFIHCFFWFVPLRFKFAKALAEAQEIAADAAAVAHRGCTATGLAQSLAAVLQAQTQMPVAGLCSLSNGAAFSFHGLCLKKRLDLGFAREMSLNPWRANVFKGAICAAFLFSVCLAWNTNIGGSRDVAGTSSKRR